MFTKLDKIEYANILNKYKKYYADLYGMSLWSKPQYLLAWLNNFLKTENA